jgi:hypothetical protein
MIPKLTDSSYCLAQARELAAQAESDPTVRGSLLRVSRLYTHLATLGPVDQKEKPNRRDEIRRKSL